MGTKSESNEEYGKSMGMQHVHARGALVIVQRIEDDTVELLAGYWAVPNVNRGGQSVGIGNDQKLLPTSRQLFHNTVAQGVGSVGMVGYMARRSPFHTCSP